MSARKMMAVGGSSTPPEVKALPKELWSAKRVAEYLDIPVGTLHQWRYLRLGPKAYRVGKWLRYDPADVARWLADECFRQVS